MRHSKQRLMVHPGRNNDPGSFLPFEIRPIPNRMASDPGKTTMEGAAAPFPQRKETPKWCGIW